MVSIFGGMKIFRKLIIVLLVSLFLSGCSKDNLNVREDVPKGSGVLVIGTHITENPGWPVSLFYKHESDPWYALAFGENEIPIWHLLRKEVPMTVRSLPVGKYELKSLTFGNSNFEMGANDGYNAFTIKPNQVTYIGDFTVDADPGFFTNSVKISMSDKSEEAKKYISNNHPKLVDKPFVSQIIKVGLKR
jgi:hypothetical protein